MNLEKPAFAAQLKQLTTSKPNHPSVIENGQYYSYVELYKMAQGIANELNKRGVSRGDYIAIAMESTAYYLALLWALCIIGCAIFPVSINRSPKEITKILRSMPFKAIIATEDALPVKFKNTLWFKDIQCVSDALNFEPTGYTQTDSVLCFQSSGSTGSAKTYIHKYQQFEHALQQYRKYYRWGANDRLYLPMPLNDTVGCFDALAALISGTTIILASRQMSVSELIGEIKQYKATYFQAMPWQIRYILGYLNTAQGFNLKVLLGGKLFPGLKEIHVSTEPFSAQEKQLARKRLCQHVYEDYGCSELWLIAKEAEQYHQCPDAVGKIVEGLNVEIVDDNDNPLPKGAIGHIRFQADYLNNHYHNNTRASDKHFRNGWFYPGDKASINKDNYLFLYGRSDDIINIKGAKYYPSEIEHFLLSHKHIQEVAVFGWPTYDGQNSSVAVVKKHKSLTHENVIDYCHQHLSAYKVPGLVILMDTLPKTRTGKIAKTVLKDQLKNNESFA